jgi:hypothetical protein
MLRMNEWSWALVLVCLGAGVSEAKPVKYAGLHPRTGQPDGGLCHIQAVHVHGAAPANAPVLYRLHDGVYFFIGDPVPFGYEGPRHGYYGHHPVVINVVLGQDADKDHVEYCYLDGPHYHSYAPPPRHDFVEKEHVQYFAGEYPESYRRDSPALVKVNAIYRPWHYTLPVVVQPPPARYRGPVLEVNVRVPVVGVDLNVGPASVLREVIVVGEPHGHGHGHGHGHKKHKKHKDRD